MLVTGICGNVKTYACVLWDVEKNMLSWLSPKKLDSFSNVPTSILKRFGKGKQSKS